MPQQTLNRIASGKTPNPRRDALELIARQTGTSLDWLLLGTGLGPAKLDEAGRPIVGAGLRFTRLLQQLGIEGSLLESLEDLPFSVFFASAVVINKESDPHSQPAYVYEALEKSTEAWIILLQNAAEELGAEHLRAALAGEQSLVALAFMPFAVWATRSKDAKPKDWIAKHYAEFELLRPDLQSERPPSRRSKGKGIRKHR
jgi:transcriptional regulator with XRE-family HTH domain